MRFLQVYFVLICAGSIAGCGGVHPPPQPTPSASRAGQAVLPYIEQSSPNRTPTEAEERTLDPYRECAAQKARAVLSDFIATEQRSDPLSLAQLASVTLARKVETACRTSLSLKKTGPLELQTIPITAVESEIGKRRNEDYEKRKMAFDQERTPIDNRYSVCLRDHAKIIALSNQDSPDLVAVAVIASCRPIFGEIETLAHKYNMLTEWNAGLQEAVEARLKDGLILWVMQARASSRPIPPALLQPSQQ